MTKETETDTLAENLASDMENRNVDAATSRRQFTRQAIMGSAVLFTLGNRPAWGQRSIPDVCISVGLWDSVANGFGASHHPPEYAGYVPLKDNPNDPPIAYCPPGTRGTGTGNGP